MRPRPRPRAERERLGLAPIRALLGRLGEPQRGLACIHVAGSKGKGSVVLLAESILERAGVRTAAFTSPHLERWTERFRVAGGEISPAVLTAAIARLAPEVEALQRADPDRAPGFFDVLTAAAFLIFRRAGVECALIETGLGGRLDATRACSALATCITTIEREHADKLGTELAAIAAEKAGIIRPRTPLTVGALPAEAARVIGAQARRLGAPLRRLGERVRLLPAAEGRLGLAWDDGLAVESAWPLAGAPHMAANAALAADCVRASGMLAGERLAGAVRDGLARACLPGRLELLGERPWVVVDCAHTEASVRALEAWLARFPARRRHLLVSLTRGKDPARVLAPLLAGAARVVATCAEPERSLPAAELAAALAGRGVSPEVVPDPRAALTGARSALGARDLLCCTGSVYLAGLARAALRPSDRPS